MRYFCYGCVVLAFHLICGIVSAEEINAPWSPGESWSYDRTTSSYHSPPYNDNCVDFNLPGSADNGRPVVSVSDGQVLYVGWHSVLGWNIKIERSDGSYDLYGHLYEEPFVGEQEVVSRGQVIGRCGCTGSGCEGSHLHYGHYVNGVSQLITKIDGQDVGQGDYAEALYSYPIDQRMSSPLNNRNPYASSQSPDQWFSGGSAGSVGWYHEYSSGYEYEDGTNTPTNCYRAIYTGGTYVGAVVYDALGGARHAYCVGDQYWATWDDLEIECSGNCPTPDCSDGDPGEGGPNSVLGMPITSHYQYTVNPSHWRQDFQKGYIMDGTIVKCYGANAPGWTSSGWNKQYSYLFTAAYERNGARRDAGNATNTVHTLSGSILIQDFSGGFDGSGMIMYDTDNSDCNEDAINEAFWVYGDIKDYYDSDPDGQYGPEVGGVAQFGCAISDRFQDGNGYWCQDFKNLDGDRYRIYASSSHIVLGTCEGGEFQAAGGGDPEGYFADHSMAMMSGDFDNDGTVNDLACIYDYDDTECRIHTWCSNGSSFVYSGPTGWWYCPTGYPAEFVRHAVAGDFDGDGYKDDIAALYDYGLQANGKYRSCWHVWLGTGSSFVYQGVGPGWWIIDGYNANLVVDAAAGDFDEDGDDDIATLYDYPGDTCAFHIWLSTGDSLVYQGPQGWWYLSSGYPSQNVKFMVAGDWDNDGDDDLATFYDYGWTGSAYRTRIHVWASTGDSLIYQGGGGWWTYDGYNMDKVTQVFAGDFNADNKVDVATLYDYGWIPAQQKYQSMLHTWFSTGSSFSYQGVWWNVYGYNAQQAWYGMSAYLNADTYADVVTAYDYSDGDTTRLHVWLSDGSDFNYQGGGGWWYSYGYPLPKQNIEEVAGILPESFTLAQNYPNPFNASTVIAYALPEASHVSVEIYNILGQRVETVFNGDQQPGRYQMIWDATGNSSGIYFYRVQTASAVETKKMVLLK